MFVILFVNCLGWAFRQLINKQIHICTVQALQSTGICHQKQNVHIDLRVRKTQLSVNQVSVYTRPQFFPSVHLFAGKIHIAHFSVDETRTLKEKNEKCQRLRSKKSEEVIPHTILTVYTYVVDTYILLSSREESLSMLVQHGKPPSLSGFSS